MKTLLPACLLSGLLSGLALALATSAAHAQSYPIHKLDFDLWCTEEMHLPFDRCAKRLPDDLQTFDDYRTKIEKYELEHLKEKNRKLHIEHTILHNDPVDNQKRPDSGPEKPSDGMSPL